MKRLRLALCGGTDQNDVAFGDGIELALARGEGDVVTAPEWLQVFPAGPSIVARDGRRWTLADPKVLVAAFASNGADLPLDIEHASEKQAPEGKPAPAQGWVKEVQVREDGTTWARMDWNDDGRAAVEGKRYRYISPAFRHRADGSIVALTSLALTTQPALRMPALARTAGRAPDHKENPHMSTLLGRLVAAFGLAATATEDDIVQAATTQVSLARATSDPERFVPTADLTAALARASTAEAELQALKAAEIDALATTRVDDAIAAGKLTPATRDHWLSIARSNPEDFDKAVSAMPAITTPTDTGKKPAGEKVGEHGLDADQLSLCRSIGIDPAAFAATLKEGATQ